MNDALRILIVSRREEVRNRLFAELAPLLERGIPITVSRPPYDPDTSWFERELVGGTAVLIDLETEPDAASLVHWLMERSVKSAIAIVALVPGDTVEADSPRWIAQGVTDVHPIEHGGADELEAIARRAMARIHLESTKLVLQRQSDRRTAKEYELVLRHRASLICGGCGATRLGAGLRRGTVLASGRFRGRRAGLGSR